MNFGSNQIWFLRATSENPYLPLRRFWKKNATPIETPLTKNKLKKEDEEVLNESLLEANNSPRKNKSAYTLTTITRLNKDSAEKPISPIINPMSSKDKEIESKSAVGSSDKGFNAGDNEESPFYPKIKALSESPKKIPKMWGQLFDTKNLNMSFEECNEELASIGIYSHITNLPIKNGDFRFMAMSRKLFTKIINWLTRQK